jgi:hypothetical protein
LRCLAWLEYLATEASGKTARQIQKGWGEIAYHITVQSIKIDTVTGKESNYVPKAAEPGKTAESVLPRVGAFSLFALPVPSTHQPLTAVTIARRPSLADLCLVIPT